MKMLSLSFSVFLSLFDRDQLISFRKTVPEFVSANVSFSGMFRIKMVGRFG